MQVSLKNRDNIWQAFPLGSEIKADIPEIQPEMQEEIMAILLTWPVVSRIPCQPKLPTKPWYQPWDPILSWNIPSPAHPALEMGWLLPLQSWSRGCRCFMQKLPPHCSQTTFIISFLLQPGLVHLFVKIWVREDRKLAVFAFCEPWPNWRHRKAA